MELRKLATFVDLAKTLNYTETASHLYITQATVSKQIKSLEEELDVELFDRSHRTVSLTTAGRFTLPYAQKIVATAAQWQDALAAKRKEAGMRLVVRAIPSISQYKAFNTIAAFTKQDPQIEMQFGEAETQTLLPSLNSGACDVVFTRLFDNDHPQYDVILGEKDHFVALVPNNQSLAQSEKLAVSQLADQSLLLLSEATGLYQPVRDLLAQAQVQPKIAYIGQRIDLVAGMVNRGMGVAIMMARSVDLGNYPNVKAVPLTPTVTSHLAFIRRHGHHTPACDAFWEFCQARN